MKNQKKKILKIGILIGLFILIIVIGTLYENNNKIKDFFDKYIFLKEKSENDLPKILSNSQEGLNTYIYKENILILKNNKLIAYNEYGNEVYSLDIEISNPIFSSNEDYLCIAEKNGKKVYVILNKMILWQKDLEGDILDVTINSKGYLAAVISGTIYKTVIQTFDNEGVKLFSQFLSTTYVMDMALSPDNKYLAVAEVNASGIIVQSNIKIISIDKAKKGEKDSIEQTFSNKDGELIINLEYQNKNELVALFDKHIEIIKDGTISKISDFSQEDVLFVETNKKSIKVINREAQCYLQIINNSTGEYKEYEIHEPKQIYVSENIIAINLGSEVLFYSDSGWVIKKYFSKQEINKIVLGKGLAGIIYNDKIELISL